MEQAAQEVSSEVSLAEAGGRVLSMTVDPGFSGRPEDIAKDIAHLQAQMTPAPAQAQAPVPPQEPQAQTQPVPAAVERPEPSQPETTPQAEATPDVPQKFQTEDGKLDAEKLAKSTANAEEALKKYAELERTLRQKQAEVNKLKTTPYPVPEPRPEGQPVQTPEAQAPDTFEGRIEADIKKEGLGPVLARLFSAASEHGYKQAVSEIEGIKTETELAKRERELKAIGQVDPWVFSEEGMTRLAEIRQQRPDLQGRPDPWTEAYKVHLGDMEYRKRTQGQVTTPNPTAAKVPPAPINAAPRSAIASVPQFTSKEAVNSHLDKMTPEQQDAFWRSQGLPPLHKKGR